MSAASEATLQELLQVNQSMAAAISKLAGQGGSGGGGGAGGGAAGKASGALGKAFNAAGTAVGITASLFGKVLDPAINAATAGFGLLVQSGKVLFANQMQLAEGAIAGTNGLASLTAGLEQLPGILGFAMKIYNYQIKVTEANLKAFQQLADTGATLGGNLNEVRSAAKGMGLSLDEFGRVMKNNTGILLNLGTTADDGARTLIKFNTTMMKGDVGRQILGMGYNAEQANNMLGLMSATMGGVTADQMKDQKSMEKSVKNFATELALSAELEGKSREEKEKEMKERAANAVRENMLSKMSREERDAYIQAENRANAIGGKGARDALLSATLGLPPLTKEAQVFTATNQKASQAVTAMTGVIKDGTLSEADRQKKITQLYGEGAKAAADNAKVYGVTGQVIALQGGKYADAMNANFKAETNARNQNLKSAEDFVNRENKARENLAKAEEGEAGRVAQKQMMTKYAGEELMNMLYKAFKPLIDLILKVNEIFLRFLPIATKFVGDVVEKGVEYLKIIFSKIDWKAVKTVAETAWQIIKDTFYFIGDIFKGIKWEGIKESFVEVWNKLTKTFGGIYDALKTAFGGFSGESIGNKLSEVFKTVMSMIGNLIEAAGYVVKLFISSPLFQTIKAMFGKLWDLIQSLVDAVVTIVKSPIGTFLIKAIMEVFDFFGMVINALIDAVTGVVNVVTGIVKFITGDFKGGWELIKKGLGQVLSGLLDFFLAIPKYVIEQVKNVWDLLKDAISGIFGSLVNGLKELGGKVVSWFKSEEKVQANAQANKSATPPATTATPTTTAPAAPSQPMTEDAKRRAAEEAKKNAPPAANPANANVPAPVKPKSNEPIEILRAEIQTLNNITAELLKAMRDTRDYTKSAANTLASNGNLFKRA